MLSIQGIITVLRYKYFSKITWWDVVKNSDVKSILFQSTFNNVYQRFKRMAAREKEIFRLSSHVIGRTAWDRRVTKVLSPSANYYHNDEILRDSFYQHQWNNRLFEKLILFTTNGPDIFKGIETLLECALLLDENKINYEWHIAGLSKDNETVRIAAASIGKPISKKLIFLGNVKEPKMVEALLQSHIYVGISHLENSPNSLCEAQILGLPCIATNAGGTASMMEDNTEGILIQDGDPFAMAGAIMEMQKDYPKAMAFGANSRKRALIRHNHGKISSDLIAIYEEMLRPEVKQSHNNN